MIQQSALRCAAVAADVSRILTRPLPRRPLPHRDARCRDARCRDAQQKPVAAEQCFVKEKEKFLASLACWETR